MFIDRNSFIDETLTCLNNANNIWEIGVKRMNLNLLTNRERFVEVINVIIESNEFKS